MTKQNDLEIVAKTNHFIAPEMIWTELCGFHHRSSVYGHLIRLHKQGLLLRQMI